MRKDETIAEGLLIIVMGVTTAGGPRVFSGKE